MNNIIKPSHFSHIHHVHKDYQSRFKYQDLREKRDYLCFTLPYLLGKPIETLLEMNFKDLISELKHPQWKKWLKQYQSQLEQPTPWFHSARHKSKRPGLSRRSIESILKLQSKRYELKNWSYKSLRHAFVLKSLQTGMSELKLRFYLGVSDHYNFSKYYQYLDQQEQADHLYLDLIPEFIK